MRTERIPGDVMDGGTLRALERFASAPRVVEVIEVVADDGSVAVDLGDYLEDIANSLAPVDEAGPTMEASTTLLAEALELMPEPVFGGCSPLSSPAGPCGVCARCRRRVPQLEGRR